MWTYIPQHKYQPSKAILFAGIHSQSRTTAAQVLLTPSNVNLIFANNSLRFALRLRFFNALSSANLFAVRGSAGSVVYEFEVRPGIETGGATGVDGFVGIEVPANI